MADSSTNQGDWHTFECEGHQFSVPKRYEDPVRIGQGAFGIVM
jgi:hypothetical protein